MALGPGLNRGSSRAAAAGRLLLIVVAVLLIHVVAVDWLARQQVQALAVKPMAVPMFTRVLEQQAVAVPVVTPVPPAPRPAPRPARAVQAQAAPEPSVPAATPTVSASAPGAITPAAVIASPEPVAVPVRVAQMPIPEPAASAPVAAPTPPVAVPAAGPAPNLDTWPNDTRLNYTLGGRFRSGDIYGTARVQWQRDGSRYQVRVNIDIQVFASLVLTSQGTVTPQGLRPAVYEELRRSGIRSARLGDKEISISGGRTVPRPDGVQDTASQFVELAHRFSSGAEKLEVGRSISLWMARPGGVDLWTYDIAGKETLKSATLGDIEAFHLKPRPIANPRGNVTAEMWFAPSLQYLPVRIRVNIGQEATVDLLVEQIEQR
jgi:hypothetical protein